jgi:large subunit ribosomal protein L29
MKAEELRTLDAEELEGKLKDARRELYELRFKLAVGQLDNHRQIRQVRKDIAQILTIVHQRRWEGWEDDVPAEPDASADTEGLAEDAVAARLASPSSAEAVEPEAVEPELVDSPEAVEGEEAPKAEAPARKGRARKADKEESE